MPKMVVVGVIEEPVPKESKDDEGPPGVKNGELDVVIGVRGRLIMDRLVSV